MKPVLAAIAILTMSAFAQPQPQGPWSEQPPMPQQQRPGGPPQPGNDSNAPGVARISFVNGNVSVRRGDSGDLVAAAVNAPLTPGDRVVTGDNGRAEVQLDFANFVRLAPGTEVRFSEIQHGGFQIELAAGSIVFRVLRESPDQIEISTPSMSVRPQKTGVYRINVRADGVTEITLRNGADGEVFGPNGSEQIHNGNTMMVRGDAANPEFQMTGLPAPDDFDRWSDSRDQSLERATSPAHVNRDVYGTEDMDPYGRWANDGSYGQVWVPQQDPGWAPYACGRWTWTPYYGWTWLGCEPWAWAPYHYGRWYMSSFGWAWWPGAVGAPYVWSPALVGFFGWGAPGFGVGVGFGWGFGNVGWVPLAPFERFRPWYGPGAFRGAGIVNVNVSSIYRNARVANAVSGMRANEFGRANVSAGNIVRATPAEMARAGAVNGRLPIAASAASRQFTARAVSTQGMPRTSENTRFFSSAGRPGGFNASGGRSAGSPAARGNFNTNSGGWQRMSPGGAAANGAERSVRSVSGSAGGGWQRFPAGGNSGATARYATQPQVRISPPIVQSPGANRSGGSSRPSAPRNSGRGGSRGKGEDHGGRR